MLLLRSPSLADAEALDSELDGHLAALLGGDGGAVAGDDGGEGNNPKTAAAELTRGMRCRLRIKRPTPYGYLDRAAQAWFQA